MERDARLHSLFYISLRVTSKGALPSGFLHRAPAEKERERERERNTPPLEPLSTITQSAG
jgi:hypothetical protein